MTTRNLFITTLATVVATALATSSPAQVTTGTIVGTVSDSSGVVPRATVTIREVHKNTSDTYVTDETGGFTAPFLTPGTYTVEVSVQGFKKWIREGVVLEVSQRARVDVVLEVGGIEETTTVVASAPLLRTDSSEIGTVIDSSTSRICRSTRGISRRSSTARPASLPARLVRISRVRARSIPAARRTSTRWATRPMRTGGSSTASTTTSTASIRSSWHHRSNRCASSRCSRASSRRSSVEAPASSLSPPSREPTRCMARRSNTGETSPSTRGTSSTARPRQGRTRRRRSAAISSVAPSVARWSFPGCTTGTAARSFSPTTPR